MAVARLAVHTEEDCLKVCRPGCHTMRSGGLREMPRRPWRFSVSVCRDVCQAPVLWSLLARHRLKLGAFITMAATSGLLGEVYGLRSGLWPTDMLPDHARGRSQSRFKLSGGSQLSSQCLLGRMVAAIAHGLFGCCWGPLRGKQAHSRAPKAGRGPKHGVEAYAGTACHRTAAVWHLLRHLGTSMATSASDLVYYAGVFQRLRSACDHVFVATNCPIYSYPPSAR